ncbi:MAG TPA: carbon monoxide dehydrogenase subunit G [Rhizomicrobium sp.]|nr:carbon monoxide dehydrogenase subunit G [Rhizomicrobium sp.]
MDFTGRYEIPASPEHVWAALNDPSILQSCIPGCEGLTRRDAHHFDAVAALRIGPVKAAFRAVIEQTELDPPRRCVLKGEGRGGPAGFGRGEAEVLLASDGKGTVLTYTARATIGGKLARIGQRLIDGAARQIADDFFARFAAQIVTGPAAPAEAAALPEPALDGAAQTEEIRREGLAPEIWVIGLIAVIIILLVLFGVAL